MNGKQSKRLRRMAEAVSIGLPDRKYEATMGGKWNKVTISLADCTRAIYRGFKRNYRSQK